MIFIGCYYLVSINSFKIKSVKSTFLAKVWKKISLSHIMSCWNCRTAFKNSKEDTVRKNCCDLVLNQICPTSSIGDKRSQMLCGVEMAKWCFAKMLNEDPRKLNEVMCTCIMSSVFNKSAITRHYYTFITEFDPLGRNCKHQMFLYSSASQLHFF